MNFKLKISIIFYFSLSILSSISIVSIDSISLSNWIPFWNHHHNNNDNNHHNNPPVKPHNHHHSYRPYAYQSFSHKYLNGFINNNKNPHNNNKKFPFNSNDNNDILSIGFINQINQYATTWQAGINFPEKTPVEFIKRLLGYKFENRFQKQMVPLIIQHNIDYRLIAPEFDSRKKWPLCDVISIIQDQGACGSSWAIASVSAMSDRLCLFSLQSLNILISAYHLMSCCSDCGDSCLGGFLPMAWKFWVEQGIVDGGLYKSANNSSCQPYNMMPIFQNLNMTKWFFEKQPKCQQRCFDDDYSSSSLLFNPFSEDYDWNPINIPDLNLNKKHPKPPNHNKTKKFLNSLTFGISAYHINSHEYDIQYEILNKGPVSAGFVVYPDFIHYKKGVYQHVKGKKPLGGHAVKIIGWGVENGVKYWLCINSWGDKWGDDGYFKILRGRNHCQIESHVFAGLPKIIDIRTIPTTATPPTTTTKKPNSTTTTTTTTTKKPTTKTTTKKHSNNYLWVGDQVEF